MTVYIAKLTKLICWCAELSTYSIGATMSPQWDEFIKESDGFFKYYNLISTREYQSFVHASGKSSSGYSSLGNTPDKDILAALLGVRQYETKAPRYFDRVFISHSSKDVDIVKPFVELLSNIGLDRNKLFCSSIDGYGIPQRENIYDYLKREFTDKNTFVVLILSDNYYDSKPSLNEMGAAWVMSKEYISILIKGFEFDKIEGAADKQKIGFKIEDTYRLDEFKDNLVQELRLKQPANWDVLRDQFLRKTKQIDNKEAK